MRYPAPKGGHDIDYRIFIAVLTLLTNKNLSPTRTSTPQSLSAYIRGISISTGSLKTARAPHSFEKAAVISLIFR